MLKNIVMSLSNVFNKFAKKIKPTLESNK
jgi:hypothetical protein